MGAEHCELIDKVEAPSSQGGVGCLCVHAQGEPHDVRSVSGRCGRDVADHPSVCADECLAQVEGDCCPALEMSTKPALMVSTCEGEKTPPGGAGRGPGVRGAGLMFSLP
jgi:hypothetical protein